MIHKKLINLIENNIISLELQKYITNTNTVTIILIIGYKMAFITWDDKYSVGINICNEQHKKLIEALNMLHKAMKQGDGNEIIGSTIKKLIDYTEIHFRTEEELFEKYNYPEKKKHVEEHNSFIKKVSDFKLDLDSRQILISINLLQFLKTWLFNHISVVDKKYSAFLNSKGVS